MKRPLAPEEEALPTETTEARGSNETREIIKESKESRDSREPKRQQLDPEDQKELEESKESPKLKTEPEEKPEEASEEADYSVPGFTYLDHTADVQIHSWGENLSEAFEQAAIGMFGYMTDLSAVEFDEDCTREIESEGHDLHSLLFAFLDELLFVFASEYIIVKRVSITSFDEAGFKIKARAEGEPWDMNKHPQGTEVKAITYSNMQIHEKTGRQHVYVIIDI